MLRNYYWAHHLSFHCHEVTVLTTKNQRFFPQAPKDLSRLHIQTLPTLDYRTLTSYFQNKNTHLHYDESTKKHPVVKFLIKLNETLPMSLLFGEGGAVYIISGVWKTLRLLQKSPNDKIIITPYRPTSNIVIGYLCKLLFSKVLWVVSMHDLPYIYKRPNSYLPRLQKYFWRHFFKKADLVTTLSQGLAEEFKSYNADCSVILNGIMPRQPLSAHNKRFTISFTGSLYDGLINPLELFKSLEDLLHRGNIDADKLRIHYAGKDGETWLRYAQDFPLTLKTIQIHPVLPHDEALSLQTISNINLLLTWNDDHVKGILTGKLFEYLGAGNPILSIIDGTTDADMESLFFQFDCGSIVYTAHENTTEHIKDFVLEKYHSWTHGLYESSYISPAALENHSWQNQTDLLWHLISQKLKNKS